MITCEWLRLCARQARSHKSLLTPHVAHKTFNRQIQISYQLTIPYLYHFKKGVLYFLAKIEAYRTYVMYRTASLLKPGQMKIDIKKSGQYRVLQNIYELL